MGVNRFRNFIQREYCIQKYSDAASGWAGRALAHPEFGSSVNPITTRGADYAHHITASPPGFENPAAALLRKIFEYTQANFVSADELGNSIVIDLMFINKTM